MMVLYATDGRAPALAARLLSRLAVPGPFVVAEIRRCAS